MANKPHSFFTSAALITAGMVVSALAPKLLGVEGARAQSSTSSESLIDRLIPSGAVMAFDLDNCPTGWRPLEAARGRTIIGVNPFGSNGLSVRWRGDAVGEEQHALTPEELASHTHTGTTQGGNRMPFYFYTEVGGWVGGMHAVGHEPTSQAWDDPAKGEDYNYPLRSHTHDFETESTGEDVAHNIMQPSLALLYCKKD